MRLLSLQTLSSPTFFFRTIPLTWHGVSPWLHRETLAVLSAHGGISSGGRLDAETGYGLSVLGDGFTGTPYLDVAASDIGCDSRLVWWLRASVPGRPQRDAWALRRARLLRRP